MLELNRAQRLLLEGFLRDGCPPRILAGHSVVEVKIRKNARNGTLERLVEEYEKAGRNPVVLLGRLFVDREKPRRGKPARKSAKAKSSAAS